MKYNKREEGVSPVIATILMVAITVVLAAVLYVMVMGMVSSGPAPDEPLGLNQQTKNSTAVTVVISWAPDSARIYGSVMSLTHDGIPGEANATLYSQNGTVMAYYSGGEWHGLPSNDTSYESGMILKITAAAVSHGDSISISGVGFGLSVMTID